MGRSIAPRTGPKGLGASGSQNIVTAAQATPQIGTDLSPGLPAASGYAMNSAAPNSYTSGPAQDQLSGGGMDNQMDPSLRLKPFFGNLY